MARLGGGWSSAVLAILLRSGPAPNVVAPEEFVFVAGGDMIGPYWTMKGIDDPGLRRVASWFQAADLGFANQQGALFDLATFGGYPSAETGPLGCRHRPSGRAPPHSGAAAPFVERVRHDRLDRRRGRPRPDRELARVSAISIWSRPE